MSQASTVDHEIARSGAMAWRPRGAILRPDPTIWWMGGGLGAFCAVPQDGETVRLFVTGRDHSIRSRIGVITLRWASHPTVIDIGPEPVFDVGELGAFDMDGVSYPWIVDRGRELWMYYVGWQRLGGEIPFRNQIGLAISTDGGRSFTRVSRAPLLPLTDQEPFGSGSVCIERTNGGWRMFYTNFLRWERRPDGPRHYYHIREAHSFDGVTWNRPGAVAVDLIPPDEYALSAPDLLVQDGRGILHFTSRGDRYRLFAAVRAANDKWTRLPNALEITRSDFDSDMQCYPRSLVFGGNSYLLYSGNGYGRSGIGFAELIDSERQRSQVR